MDRYFQQNLKGNIYALDSTTIDLCLSVFWWTEFHTTKGGIKLHILCDIKTFIPSFIHVSTASVNDVIAMDLLYYEPGGYCIFIVDTSIMKVFLEYIRVLLTSWSRQKTIYNIEDMYSKKVNKDNGVLLDQIGKLTGYYVSRKYPEKL